MSKLDLESVFSSADGSIGESEAIEVKTLLEANGIHAIVNESPISSLGKDVRVARKDLEEARRVIAAAREAGPKGAAEAEKETE